MTDATIETDSTTEVEESTPIDKKTLIVAGATVVAFAALTVLKIKRLRSTATGDQETETDNAETDSTTEQ